MYDVVMPPRFGTWCNIGVGVTVEVISTVYYNRHEEWRRGYRCYATPKLGIPVVYIELKLSPMYHLEEGIKEESRNMYFCLM